jgi:adsorption protein B
MELIDLIALYWLGIKILLYLSAIVIFVSSLDDAFIDIYYWVRRLYRALFVRPKHPPMAAEKLYSIPERPIAIMSLCNVNPDNPLGTDFLVGDSGYKYTLYSGTVSTPDYSKNY